LLINRHRNWATTETQALGNFISHIDPSGAIRLP
jgi:hypothetical protein